MSPLFLVCLEMEYFHFEGAFALDKFTHPKLIRSPHNSTKQHKALMSVASIHPSLCGEPGPRPCS